MCEGRDAAQREKLTGAAQPIHWAGMWEQLDRLIPPQHRPVAIAVVLGTGGLLVMSCCCAGGMRLAFPPKPTAVAGPAKDEQAFVDAMTLRLQQQKLINAIVAGTDELDPANAQPGDIRRFFRTVNVMQVIDDKSFLGTVRGRTVYFLDVNTAGLADGREWNPAGHGFEVVDPVKYKTVLNAHRTVMAVIRFDAKRAIEEAAEKVERKKGRGPI